MKNKARKLKSAIEKADDLRVKARYRESLAALTRALKACGPREFGELYSCHLLAGHNWRMLGDFGKAIAHYEKAIASAGKMEKNPQEQEMSRNADASVSMALAYRALGDWKKALQLLKEAERTYRRLKDDEALAFVLWSKGGTFRIKGDIGRAIGSLTEARKMFAALGDEHAVGYCLNGLGGASRIKGAYKASLGYYTKANTLFRRLKDPFGLAYSFCGTGNAMRMMERHEEALGQFRRALKTYKKIGDIVSSSYTLWSVSKSLLFTGKMEKAEKTLKEAEKFFAKTKDPRGGIYCLLSEAELEAMKGRAKKAAVLASRALDDSKKHGFAIELCHARALLGSLGARDGGKADMGCYKKLGLKKPDFRKAPVNLP